MRGSSTRANRFLAAFLLMGSVAAGEAQSRPTLNALTVPAEALPSGCTLKQPAPPAPSSRADGTIIRTAEWSPFPANPWSGTDRTLVTEVSLAIDGTPPLPDGPPLDPAGAAAFRSKLADNVVEAYRAAYASADASEVVVWALRFNDDALASPEGLSGKRYTLRGFRSRFVRGATVTVVAAPSSNACVLAVDSYIRTLE